ncbi:hypothetical protein QTV49_000508 [Vibrio vulnificus]|nr:hypothetical protein [Vibrio vulnificus]
MVNLKPKTIREYHKASVELAREYLENPLLTLSGTQLSKPKQVERYNAYLEMVEMTRKARKLEAKYPESKWEAAFLFPDGADQEILEDSREWNKLTKAAAEIWRKTY